METYTYKRGLELVSESATEYEKQRNLYENKKKELYGVENRINDIKDHICKLKGAVLSLDDLKIEAIKQAESLCEIEVKEAEEVLKKKVNEINNSALEDKQAEETIRTTYSKKISEAYVSVANIEKQIKCTEENICNYKTESDNLELQISNAALEENQIRLCAEHIACEYESVANNAEFISDYRDPRGASPTEAQNKFASLSPKKIKKIATKMNSGAYVSSPDETKGLPILEILFMAATTLWMILKGVFHGVCMLYKPVQRFYKITHKIIYVSVVTVLLILLFFFVSSKFGDGIVAILLILLFGVLAIFVGMILFNIIKYSNKTFRKELDLEYYTVGYYFTVEKDEILFKIASDYYLQLKEKNPVELENILQSTVGVITDKKHKVDIELAESQTLLSKLQNNRIVAVEQYESEKERLEAERNKLIDTTLEQLRNDRNNKLIVLKQECENKIALCKTKKKDAIENAEKNAIATLERNENEISNSEKLLDDAINSRESILAYMNDAVKKVDEALKQNHEIASTYKKQKISAVDKRSENDQIPDTLVAGLIGTRQANLVSGEQEVIYTQYKLKHSKKPIIITCDIDDDESKVLTENYYSFVDSLIGDLLGKTYMGAFRFVLVDSQGNKSGILKYMETCRDAFDTLEKYDCVKIINDRTDKCFDEIIKEQENKLGGKTIDSVNEKNKNLDNMVKYNFLCLRIYSKKTSDFSVGDFRKRIDNSLNNGIIPILIMSQNYFNEKRNDLEGTIKELCDNCYYYFDLNKSASNEVKEINLLRKSI